MQRGNLVPFVYTHVRTDGRGSVPAGVCGVLYDSIVALMAPLAPHPCMCVCLCVCVGGGAHRGMCWWPSENAFDVYHPPGTRPADYISRDRADFTNTGRVEYVRGEGRPCDPHTWWISRGGGSRRTPFSCLLLLPPRSTTFGQFLFIVSPLRSFNSRFSCWSSLVIAVESSVNQGTACKRLVRGGGTLRWD